MDPVLAEFVCNNDVYGLRKHLDLHQEVHEKLLLSVYSLKSRFHQATFSKSGICLLPHNGLTLVHLAAFYDSMEVFLLFLELGGSIRERSGAGYFPIHYACVSNSLEVVSYILDNDPNAIEFNRELDFQHVHAAVFSNSTEILRLFFDHGIDFQKTPDSRKYISQLVKQAILSQNIECLVIFLNNGGISSFQQSDSTPLMTAVNCGLHEAILPLIEYGVDIYKHNMKGYTALSIACVMNDVESVKILVENMHVIDINDPIFKYIFWKI